MPKSKNSQFGEFLKTEVIDQTVLPYRSLLKGQKLMENAKIKELSIWRVFEKKVENAKISKIQVRHFG